VGFLKKRLPNFFLIENTEKKKTLYTNILVITVQNMANLPVKFICCAIRRKHRICVKNKVQKFEKKMTILFFVYFGTYNNKIHTIYKQTSVFVLVFSMFLFWFFPCCCFGFISKAATTKNLQFIYDLSMLCLGLGKKLHKILIVYKKHGNCILIYMYVAGVFFL
jgi:hypothetical protein